MDPYDYPGYHADGDYRDQDYRSSRSEERPSTVVVMRGLPLTASEREASCCSWFLEIGMALEGAIDYFVHSFMNSLFIDVLRVHLSAVCCRRHFAVYLPICSFIIGLATAASASNRCSFVFQIEEAVRMFDMSVKDVRLIRNVLTGEFSLGCPSLFLVQGFICRKILAWPVEWECGIYFADVRRRVMIDCK